MSCAGGSRPSEALEPPSSETHERVPGAAARGEEEGAVPAAPLPRGQARHQAGVPDQDRGAGAPPGTGQYSSQKRCLKFIWSWG